jgi:hypothetical protein
VVLGAPITLYQLSETLTHLASGRDSAARRPSSKSQGLRELVLVAVETVKKNPAFSALITQLGAQLDKMSDVELRNWLDERARRFASFRSFVVSNEEPLRKIAESTSELRWMLRYVDFVVAKRGRMG